VAVELQNAELQLQRAGQRLGDQIRIAAAGSLGRSLDPLREELAKVSRVADALAVLDIARQDEPSLTQAHHLIRSGDEYGDLFELATQQNAEQLLNPQPRETKPHEHDHATN